MKKVFLNEILQETIYMYQPECCNYPDAEKIKFKARGDGITDLEDESQLILMMKSQL